MYCCCNSSGKCSSSFIMLASRTGISWLRNAKLFSGGSLTPKVMKWLSFRGNGRRFEYSLYLCIQFVCEVDDELEVDLGLTDVMAAVSLEVAGSMRFMFEFVCGTMVLRRAIALADVVFWD